MGRQRDSGAPNGADDEFAPIDLDATKPDGTHVMPVDAHIAVANQDANAVHLLRRGYNFTDGLDATTGQLDAGLFVFAVPPGIAPGGWIGETLFA